jgi:hypothetical protein
LIVSLELILLLFFFVLLPVIRQLLQAAKERSARTPEGSESQPLPAPPGDAPLPWTVPSLAETAPHPAFGALSRVAYDAEPVRRAPTPHSGTQRRRRVVGLRNHSELRNAMVLMAILGPCRAISPYDWTERAGQ